MNERQSGVDTSSITTRLAIIAALVVLYFLVVGRTRLFNDADTLWHIAVGRATLDSGLVTRDQFSFTRYGEPWVANQWLAQCILAVSDRLGGFDGVLVLTVTVLTATYVALGYRWLAHGFDPVLTLAFLTLILASSAYTTNARPHIVSIGLLGITFALLRDVEDGRCKPATLAWLVPLFIVWSNLHGGVLGGLCTFGLVAAGWTAQWALSRILLPASGYPHSARHGDSSTSSIQQRPSSIQHLAVIWLCVAGCALALFATPYGFGSLKAWLAILTMSLPDFVIEHSPLHPGTPQGSLAILLFVVYLVIFAVTPKAWSRPTFYLPLVWFALTCTRIRHAPLFAIVAGIALADLLPQSRVSPWLRRRGWLKPNTPLPPGAVATGTDAQNSPYRSITRCLSQRERRKSPPDSLTLPVRGYIAATARIAAVVFILTAPLFGAAMCLKQIGPLPLVGSSWARLPDRVWPAGLIEPLTIYARSQPDAARVFNEPILGGFLIYNFPDMRVFIDGRCELYGEPFLRDFIAAWHDPQRVGQWERQYGFRAALLENGSSLERYFRAQPSWQELRRTTAAVLYVRSEEEVLE